MFPTSMPSCSTDPLGTCKSARMKLSEWEANTIFGEPTSADPETFLYHYTSVERAAGIALLGSISLSPLGPMNDPRESQGEFKG